MFDRLFFSADLGDGGGGGPDGGVDAGAALDAGAAGGETEAWDANAWVEQQGGREAVERMHREHGEINNRFRYDPQFRDTLQKALKGEYGPQAQQQAQQQQAQQGGQQGQQQQQGWLQYEPATRAEMQTFYRLLEQAKESGDPEAVQRVYNDPQNTKAKEAYLGHQNEMNQQWWDPRAFQTKMFQDPEMQQLRQQEYEQYSQPQMQEMNTNFKTMWYMQNKQAIDSLPQQVRQALDKGFYGEIGPHVGFLQWMQACQSALQDAQKFAVAGNANAGAPANQNAGGTATERRMNNPPPKNGLKGKEDESLDGRDQYKKFAREMAKDKLKDR